MKKVIDYVPEARSHYIPHARVYAPVANGNGEILPSMTKQEFLEQCDINNIIKSFSRTGQITHISSKAAKGAYVDLPDVEDFQTALNIQLQANEAFMSLPAKVRRRFDDDPAAFLSFLGDPKNEEEARELGLLNPKAPDSQSEPKTSPAPEKPA